MTLYYITLFSYITLRHISILLVSIVLWVYIVEYSLTQHSANVIGLTIYCIHALFSCTFVA